MAQDPQAGFEGSYDSCHAFLMKIQEFVKENTLSVNEYAFYFIILSWYSNTDINGAVRKPSADRLQSGHPRLSL
jgi:hypothetical protein